MARRAKAPKRVASGIRPPARGALGSTAMDPEAAATHVEPTMRMQALRWGFMSWFICRVGATAGSLIALTRLRIGETVAVHDYVPPIEAGRLAHWLVKPWLRADALWYLKIAAVGYRHDGQSVEFFPVFPLLVRLMRPAFRGDEVVAGLIVANICALAGFILLYLLIARCVSSSAARTTVLGLAVFPTAFWFVAPYAEPVVLLLTVGAALAAVSRKDAWAVVLGFLAALSRPPAILVAMLVLALSLRAGRSVRRAVLLASAPVLGFITWFIAAGVITGNPIGLVKTADYWQRKPAFFLLSLWQGVKAWWTYRGSDYGPYFLMDIFSVAFGIGLVVAATVVLRRAGGWKLAWGFGVFGALILLMPLSSVFALRPFSSFPRYILGLAPLWVGYCLIPRWARIPLGVISFAGSVLVTALYVAARPIF